MESADSGPLPDYVLFYAKLSSFPEDATCAVKHACRRAFSLRAVACGLKIDKRSAELSTTPTTEADKGRASQTSGQGRRSKRGRAPYKAFYWGVRATATALLREAEYTRLELPLRNSDGNPCSQPNAADIDDAADKLFHRRIEFVSAPFVYSRKLAFYGGGKSESSGKELGDNSVPLTAAQRIYLTHSILHRIDISEDLQRSLGPQPEGKCCTQDCVFCACLKKKIVSNFPIVLEHLLEARIFADAFAMHDRDAGTEPEQQPVTAMSCCPAGRDSASVSPRAADIYEMTGSAEPSTEPSAKPSTKPSTMDARQQLRRTWLSCCSCQQPLRLIRQYFGERLAFYYAWLGHMIASLHCLNAIGLACLVYGLINASLYHRTEAANLISALANATVTPSDGNAFAISLTELMQFIRLMFENHLTIPFGCLLTAWHLVTAESWRSSEAALSHRWGVKHHDLGESPRPAVAQGREDSVKLAGRLPSGERCCKTSPQFRRCLGPLAVLVFCAAIAIAVAVSIEVSKLVAAHRHCGSQAACILLSVVLPIGGHIVVMTLLDWGYSHIAKKMTDWEKHELQSDHDSAYAIKAFAFRFANNFASMLYTAFVRQQKVTFGDFTDSCVQDKLNIDCFNMLSVYAAGYIIGKSLLKLLVDFVSHHASKKGRTPSSCLSGPLRRLLCSCGASLRRVAYAAELDILAALEKRVPAAPVGSPTVSQQQVMARERAMPKEKSADQQLDEYLEKMTLHGYLVMFGSACYVAPLAVLIALLVDLRLDASRLGSSHRRPVPLPAQGVGVWNPVRDFLGHAGVLTTAGILGFSSDGLRVYGLEQSLANRLVLFVAFSGAMYLFKYLVAAFYSSRSESLKRRLNWEYQNVQGILDAGSVSQDALESLNRTMASSRWCPVLLPCLAGSAASGPRTEPYLLV